MITTVTPDRAAASAARVREETARLAQRLEALGRLTAATAHELNNLLTVITANAALLVARAPADPEGHAEFADLETASRDATQLLKRLTELARDAAVGAAPLPEATEAPGRGGTVLLVDDEEAIRRAGARTLERSGYRVVAVEDGAAALAVWREHRDAITLVITDITMPRLSGPALERAVRAAGGSLPFVFTSGYAPQDVAALGELGPQAVFLHKPWTREDLLHRVRTALGRAAAA